MEGLRAEIEDKKQKLEILEKALESQISTLSIKEENYKNLCSEIDSIKSNIGEDILTINCSGVIHYTKVKTLLSVRDTLFTKIIHSREFNLKEVIYFDRNPKFFLMILDYLRFRRMDIKRLSKDDKMGLKIRSSIL